MGKKNSCADGDKDLKGIFFLNILFFFRFYIFLIKNENVIVSNFIHMYINLWTMFHPWTP